MHSLYCSKNASTTSSQSSSSGAVEQQKEKVLSYSLGVIMCTINYNFEITVYALYF